MHRWNVTPGRAVEIQHDLRDLVEIRRLAPVAVVAGVDCAFSAEYVFAAAVVWDIESRAVLETRALRHPLNFPYIPGLLSFREAPALKAVLRRVNTPYDAVLCDGQGLAHPRRLGLACHLGVLLQQATVGCAKSRLVGEYVEPGNGRGAISALTIGSERVGSVLRTRTGVKPVFVSPGHLCNQAGAVALVLRCTDGYRLPEPVRLADRRVGEFKRSGRYGR